jgi:hypothetical protein
MQTVHAQRGENSPPPSPPSFCCGKTHRNSKSQMSLEQHPVAIHVCVFGVCNHLMERTMLQTENTKKARRRRTEKRKKEV